MRDTAGDLPLFGHQAWTGILLTGRWSFRDDGTGRATTIGLEHGDPDDEQAPWLHVLVTCGSADSLVRDLHVEQVRRDRRATVPVERAPSDQRQVEIVVDGRPRTFRFWETGDCWYAACELDQQHAVVLAARHVDPADVALIPVHDIEPYLAGRRDWIRAREQSD
ncbi:hypothetical protein [Prauserella aidingensis]|uniref:hypothetical protein n=1 Tax=Prauserella aidingensis TaxID=387890 RepID=UPI0020A47311|nr:hypothetical protein [Prauserella aidingensis]